MAFIRQWIACICLLALTAGVTGCVGGPAGTATDLTDENATERALDAEEAFVSARLANATCVSEWGTEPTVVDREATVADRTDEGVSVDVTQPYWYATERDEADGGSNARYLVTAERVQRVSGEEVSPC